MKKNKKKFNIMILIPSILLILILGVLTYNTFFKQEKLTKDSYVVNYLYSYINLDYSINALWEEILYPDKDILYIKDLTQSQKNYIGYEFMSAKGQDVEACYKEIRDLFKNYNNGELYCGYISYDNSLDGSVTTIVWGKELKKSVENFFGPNSYDEAPFKATHELLEQKYVYYAPRNYYVYGSCDTCYGQPSDYKTTLNSVNNKEKETIVLNVNLKSSYASDVNGTNYNFTYKLSNNNYYLYSVEKEG